LLVRQSNTENPSPKKLGESTKKGLKKGGRTNNWSPQPTASEQTVVQATMQTMVRPAASEQTVVQPTEQLAVQPTEETVVQPAEQIGMQSAAIEQTVVQLAASEQTVV
jgi:hypothetical protein